MKIKIHLARNISHPFPIFAWGIIFASGKFPWDKSAPSHMAISYQEEGGPEEFFDMTGKGAKKSTEKKFNENYKITETHELNLEVPYIQFLSWFDRYANTKYDGLQIFGLLLKALHIVSFNKLGKDLKRLICTELVISFLEVFAGFKYKDSDNFDLINTWDKVKEY